ncbi:MAG: FAD-dependent oxidoreductase [Pseudomonadota bacterium]
MNSGESMNTEKLQTDLVIIGGGGAGLAAGVAAAEKGAKVVILEKRRAPGGNSVFAEGLFAAESPAQKRMMIDARRDELFKIAMDFAHWKLNPRIVRAFVNKSGHTIQWLEEKGLGFDWIPPLYPNQTLRVWHCLKKGGAAIVKVLLKNCEELGVRLLRQTAARKILINDQGEVTGLLAAAREKELRIAAKSVIIATGGYSGNKELLKKYCPSYNEEMQCPGLLHNGDGLLMAIETGAATEGLGFLQLNGQRFPGSKYLNAVAAEPNMIWVNKYGQRYADETITFRFEQRGNAVDRQPGKIAYTIFDDKIKQKIIEEGLIKGVGVIIVPQRTKLPDLDKDLRAEVDKGTIKISNSWGQIAKWIGAAPEVMKAAIDEYNAFCDQGHDEIFAKDRMYLEPLRTPPYYAMKCYAGFLGTIGGIKINEHMQVIDTQDKPIPGLYAAGVDTGGWESDTYCTMLSGSTFGYAINSGRIAGENAVKYNSGKQIK